MKKTTIASLAFLAVSIALTANTYATTPPVPSADTATFTKEPSTWAPEWDGSSSPYSRNIFGIFQRIRQPLHQVVKVQKTRHILE